MMQCFKLHITVVVMSNVGVVQTLGASWFRPEFLTDIKLAPSFGSFPYISIMACIVGLY